MKMETLTLTINGVEVKSKRGATVLEAARDAEIYIPTLCHDPDLEPYGACRLCVVEIEGMRGLPTACTTPATDGMVVRTETPQVNRVRRTTIELLSADHPRECLTCPRNQRCDLQKVAAYLGLRGLPFKKTTRERSIDSSNPFFDRDMNYCILCGKCVRTCDEILGVGAIAFTFRGYASEIATFGDKPILESNCVSCGECVVRCPTAALVPKKLTPPTQELKTICPYCGVGCGIYLGLRGGEVVSVEGDPESPANKGKLCVKGRFGIIDFVNHAERLTSPLVRKDGALVEASWDEALDLVASKLAQYKGDKFAAISSAKGTNEENYLIQRFTRSVMGTNNIDHCARLCHAPTVAGLVQSFGSAAMTNSIPEIGDAKCILAIGTNTTSGHPIIGLEVKRAVRAGAKLIVANPREIDLCNFSTIWLRHRPGSDVALLMGMMKVIVDEGLLDSAFIEERCENFEEFRQSLKAFDPDTVEQITGVPQDKIAEAARIYAQNSPATILYAMGITQHSHGTDNVIATANLAMLTGNIGKPSTGVNPLRGQNNVQGACDMGALPNVFPGYQSVADPDMRAKFEKAWGSNLSESPGLTLTEMIGAADQGQVKAIYLVGENPLLSEPDAHHAEEALKKLDFLVVQDIFLTETAQLAHVVLPAASFAEKDGTFTNTERRVQRVRKAIEPKGDSKPDWWITCQIAKRLGAEGFDFDNPLQIMDEIAQLTPSYAGISYERLENGGLQWPCPTKEHPGTPIIHTQRFTRGKGRFLPLEYKPSLELPDGEYPLILTTGRSLYHFHTGTMTRKVSGLNVLNGEELVEMNPEDAQNLGIADGDRVRVASRRGEVEARAKVTEASPPGVISMSFHFTETRTNLLTNPGLDPVAKIPELKVCAVWVKKAE